MQLSWLPHSPKHSKEKSSLSCSCPGNEAVNWPFSSFCLDFRRNQPALKWACSNQQHKFKIFVARQPFHPSATAGQHTTATVTGKHCFSTPAMQSVLPLHRSEGNTEKCRQKLHHPKQFHSHQYYACLGTERNASVKGGKVPAFFFLLGRGSGLLLQL